MLRENGDGVIQAEPVLGFFETYKRVFRNTPYVLILSVYTLHVTAITIVSGIAIYYFKYIHNDEPKTTIAMLILLGTAMIFIPVSVFLAKKMGKKRVYGLGMLIFSVVILLLYAVGHTQDISVSFVLMFFAGIGMGFTYALPYAIVPDAVGYDYLLTGRRTQGAFYGIWTFGIKIGQAMALGITGIVLSCTGYLPDVVQTDSAMHGIRLLLGPLPAVFFILAMITLYFYPINEKRYNEILTKIKEMEKIRSPFETMQWVWETTPDPRGSPRKSRAF